MVDHLDDIARLDQLRREGFLSEGEFLREKQRLLAPPARIGIRWGAVGGIAAVTLAVIFVAVVALLLSGPPTDDGHAATFRAPSAQSEGALANAAAVAATPVSAPTTAPTTETPGSTTLTDSGIVASNRDMADDDDLPMAQGNLLAAEQDADEQCRGSSDPRIIRNWCPKRDRLVAQMEASGMCFGRPSDRSAAESSWHMCDQADRPSRAPTTTVTNAF